MPSRLRVAHERPAWLRYGAVVPLLGLTSVLTWAIPTVREHTPFMFFFGAAAIAAAFGGLGAAALAVLGSLLVVERVISPDAGAGFFLNDVGFAFVSGLIVVLADWAMRRGRRERALREWAEVTLKSVGDGVIVTDAQGRVLTMNAVAERLTGWSEAEADQVPLGKIFEIVNEETRSAVENPIDRVRREGVSVGLANHTVLLARDGREIPIDDNAAPIRSEDGDVVGAVLVFRDITERREGDRLRAAALERERAARAEAQAANRAKDDFLAVLSHELRTPLSAILGWAQVLRSVDLAPEATRGLDAIERSAHRQVRLVDDLLDASRIAAGTLRLELGRVDFRQVVEAAVDTVRPLLEAKRLTLEVKGDCGGAVIGDAHRLQQVVWNLLSNAIKFTPAGGRVDVELARDDTECAVTVRDTGVGIAASFLPLVFERFRQEESGSARRFGGLGLGLTIVRQLVELHGGSVSASSDGPGHGACFTVRLRLARELAKSAETARALASAETGGPRLDGIRVLAVDDDPDARDFVSEILRHAGAAVRVADSGDAVLAHLKESAADVLIADVEMPGEDGLALLRRVREAGHALPAIALTAHSSVEDRIRVLAAGFGQHLPKPVDVAELRLVVASAVSHLPHETGR